MKSIIIRKSKNPDKKTSYALFFQCDSRITHRFVSKNESVVDVGHIINNYLNHDSVPVEDVPVTLHPCDCVHVCGNCGEKVKSNIVRADTMIDG